MSPDSRPRIIVVDDDPDISRMIADYLGQHELAVEVARDGRTMRAALGRGVADLIVLDLMLPGEDGLTLIRALRSAADTAQIPVLMLTARADDVDRVVGLELGADDYLGKPFLPRELLARIRALLRRAAGRPARHAHAQEARYLAFGDWVLDSFERHLIAPGGTITLLNAAEFGLLVLLLEHANRIVSRDEILLALAGRETEAYDRVIDLRISRLRRRLGDDARTPSYVKTVRNEGYVLSKAVVALASLPDRFTLTGAR